MATTSKAVTPAQAYRIASKLLEHHDAIRAAQKSYQRTHESAHKLAQDVEAKRLALESLQSAYIISPGQERDFELYEKSRRKLARTESVYGAADEAFKKAQAAYDKSKGAKNTKNLQAAREAVDKLKSKMNKDTAEFYERVGAIAEISSAKRTAPQLEKALKAYEEAVNQHQKSLPKVQKARQALQKAWDDQAKYLATLKRKKTSF